MPLTSGPTGPNVGIGDSQASNLREMEFLEVGVSPVETWLLNYGSISLITPQEVLPNFRLRNELEICGRHKGRNETRHP